MTINIQYNCPCGFKGLFKTNVNSVVFGAAIALHPCYTGADHDTYITIKSIDAVSGLVDFIVSIQKH